MLKSALFYKKVFCSSDFTLFLPFYFAKCVFKACIYNCKNITLGYEILVISLYFLKYKILQTKLPSEYVDCVIIHQNLEIGIEYFLEKVINFDF